MHAVRLRGAVADHVISHFAARRFYRLINLALRHGKAFRNNLKVIDERFHLRLHLFAIRKNHMRGVGFNRPFRHAFNRLLHDADRFAQLLHPAHISGKDVAFCRHRHFELEVFVARIRHITAKVEIHSARAHVGPLAPERLRLPQ